jgi:hypothetical protein
VLDIIDHLKHVVDAPPQALLACPIGLIAALHFASASEDEIKGARNDAVVRLARAEAVKRPAWVKGVGVSLGLCVAVANYLYIQDPNFLAQISRFIPV